MRQQSDGIKGTYSRGSSLNWLGSESFVISEMVFVCIISSAGRNQMSRRNLGAKPYKLYNLTIVVHISEGLLRATFYHSLDRKSSFVQNVPIYFEDLQVNQLCIGFFTNEAFHFFFTTPFHTFIQWLTLHQQIG